jgi:hypothetical protein
VTQRPLLGNGFLTSKNWTTEQRCFCGPVSNSWTATKELCFLCCPRPDVISRTINESEWMQRKVGEWVRKLRFNPCEPLFVEAGSWGTGIVRESRGRGTPFVGSRYHATNGEHSRFSACCSELQSVRISDSAIVSCSYDLWAFNKSNYQSKHRL